MATIEFSGVDEYISKLKDLGANVTGAIKQAVYPAADIVADEVRRSVEALPEISKGDAIVGWKTSTPADGVTPEQKKGLLQGLYLKKFQNEDGFIYTELGFTGYNEVKTSAYPQGQANAMIARAIESGSSARTKKPFIRPAVNRVKGAAETEIEVQFNRICQKIMNGGK